MSWRDKPTEDCVAACCASTAASPRTPTMTTGACLTDDACQERGRTRGLHRGGRAEVIEEVEVGAADSGGRTPFRPDAPRVAPLLQQIVASSKPRYQPLIGRHGTRLCKRSSAYRRTRRVSLRRARTYSPASALRSQGRTAGNRILDHTEGLEDAQSKTCDRLRRGDACDARSTSRASICPKPPLPIAR
jgi:hypothetical protein